MPKTLDADENDRHYSDVNALLFHNGKLYSGADDGKIKVWDENLKLLGQIDEAHSRSVYSLAASDDTLYSGSNDGAIKSWNLSDLKPKKTLSQAPREVWRMIWENGTLYTGDTKGSVELYVRDHLSQVINLIKPIRGLMVMDNLLYTMQDLDIVIRLIRSRYGDFERRKTIMGSVPMCIAGDKLLFCSQSGQDIHLRENSIDLNFKDIAELQEAHDARIYAMIGCKQGNDTLLYTGGGDKVVKQWKIEGKSLNKISHVPFKTGISVMTVGSNGEIYVGCQDGYMNRLDF